MDTLNQVGKSLGKTKKNAEYAVKRFSPNIPKIERTRDIFDSLLPFEMPFSSENGALVSLDLYFNKPPPISCRGNGTFGMCCQNFTIAGNSLLTITNPPYQPGSVTVILNGVLLTPNVQFEERDPTVGLVYVQGTGFLDVCYVRENTG